MRAVRDSRRLHARERHYGQYAVIKYVIAHKGTCNCAHTWNYTRSTCIASNVDYNVHLLMLKYRLYVPER